MFESLTPVVDGVSSKVTSAFNALLGDTYLPSTDVDGHKDAPTKEFFTRLLVFAVLCLDASDAGDVVRSRNLGDRLVCVLISDPHCRGHCAWVVRRLKYESFAVHHPTLYQVALSSPTVLLICAFAVMLMPWFIPAWVAALFYVAFLMSIHLIVSNFHRFG